MRYCCQHLKELHGQGRVVVTGVRWAESGNRKNNQGLVTFTTASKELNNAADLSGAEPNLTSKGGLILNTDNDENRRMVEMCYRTHKTLVNPIIDWPDEDVWEFIKRYNVPYCELYDFGFKRLALWAVMRVCKGILSFSHNSSHSIFAPLMRCWTHGEKRENPSIGIGRTANRSCAGG